MAALKNDFSNAIQTEDWLKFYEAEKSLKEQISNTSYMKDKQEVLDILTKNTESGRKRLIGSLLNLQ